jgi:hypothetical protein
MNDNNEFIAYMLGEIYMTDCYACKAPSEEVMHKGVLVWGTCAQSFWFSPLAQET